MKFDLYTKVVMTVIAVSLMKIAFTDMSLVNSVSASSGDKVQKIAICNKSGTRCSKISSGYSLKVSDN